MNDTLTRLRVLRAAGYRCGFRGEDRRPCGAPASLVAHPAPAPNIAPMIAVCKQHAKVAQP